MTEPYDSKTDTLNHIERVQTLMSECLINLEERMFDHDQSKLKEPEKSAFDRLTPRLKELEYGSEAYRASLREMQPAINHHYMVSDHHPENHATWTRAPLVAGEPVAGADGTLWKTAAPPADDHWTFDKDEVASGKAIGNMSLMALLEMVADWKAASERHATGDLGKSLEINRERFGIGEQLQSIIEATVAELGW